MRTFVLLILLAFLFVANSLFAQTNDTITKVKRHSFVPLPAVSFDSDLGFQYGLLGSYNYYGDGSVYPDYKMNIYGEWSRYTKGSGTNQLFLDSKYIMPFGIRVTADFSLLTEKALDFYGFNGFEAAYHPEYEDDDENNPEYISRMFYRVERRLIRLSADFQKPLSNKNLRGLIGYGFFKNEIGVVDINKMNEGLDEADKLPAVDGLYQRYVNWGIINAEEANGGSINSIKLGLVYDTRDYEPDPQKGLWAEALVMTAPSFLGNDEAAYTKLALIFRHYVPIVQKKLLFAYRLGWQGTIDGEAPFYMQSYMVTSNLKVTKNDMLGGAKSLRGILRNRVVGDAVLYANLELRYRVLQTRVAGTELGITVSAFNDFGKVTNPIEINPALLPGPVPLTDYFDQQKDGLHYSYGLGVHFDIARNLLLTVNYGLASDKRDGDSGLYIGIGFLF